VGDILEGAPVMMGTFAIRGKPIRVLFDSGATHSFMNGKTLSKVGLNVATPMTHLQLKQREGTFLPSW
jgi:predicted aspartyl protease